MINMQGVNSVHSGIEAELDYKPYKWVAIRGMLSLGDWKWTNNPTGYFYNSGGQPITKDKKVASGIQAPDHATMVIHQKNVKEGGSAQFTTSLGITLYPMDGVRVGLDWKHFGSYYADYAVSANDISLGGEKVFATPWKLPSYNLFDLRLHLQHGRPSHHPLRQHRESLQPRVHCRSHGRRHPRLALGLPRILRFRPSDVG